MKNLAPRFVLASRKTFATGRGGIGRVLDRLVRSSKYEKLEQCLASSP